MFSARRSAEASGLAQPEGPRVQRLPVLDPGTLTAVQDFDIAERFAHIAKVDRPLGAAVLPRGISQKPPILKIKVSRPGRIGGAYIRLRGARPRLLMRSSLVRRP